MNEAMMFLGPDGLSLLIAILYFTPLILSDFHWLCVGIWVGRWLGKAYFWLVGS